jgi:hypothetical protein
VRKTMRSFRYRLFLPTFISLAILLHASTVEQVSVGAMLKGSEAVFEGRVTAVEARLSANKQSVETLVTFQILDVVKGAPASKVILSFPGGETQGLRMKVAGMNLPRMGDRGIYFVESLKKLLVHPFYGWDQGHFLVRSVQGAEVVTTFDGRPIVGLDVSLATKQPAALSAGVAYGIQTAQESSRTAPLTPTQFKSALRSLNALVR